MYTKVVNHIVEKEAKLLYMYSGHDTSIATILGSLKMFNGLAPPYASAVLFELFKGEEEKHFVRIVYRNDTAVGHIRYLADSLVAINFYFSVKTILQRTLIQTSIETPLLYQLRIYMYICCAFSLRFLCAKFILFIIAYFSITNKLLT